MAAFGLFQSTFRVFRTTRATCATAVVGAITAVGQGSATTKCDIQNVHPAVKNELPWYMPKERWPNYVQCTDLHMKFTFASRTDTYTPVFQHAPVARTASVNTNATLLKNYARSVGNVGIKEDVYDRLYSAMLSEAQSSRGSLRTAPPKVAGIINDLGLIGCFSRAPVRTLDSRGIYGAVFIDVYKLPLRPLSEKNVALIYVEGPCGQNLIGNAGPFSSNRPVIHDCDDFLSAVEDTAANVMLAVREYNNLALASRGNLPSILVLQYCLVSGSVTKHPDASKFDVALASVRGLMKGASASVAGVTEDLPAVHFSYDEGVFEKAVSVAKGEMAISP